MLAVKSRSYLSIPMLFGAAAISRLAAEIEFGPRDLVDDRRMVEHRGLVVAAVTSSVASLESMINEFLGDAADEGANRFLPYKKPVLQALAAIRRQLPGDRKESKILRKFDAALVVVTGAPFDRADTRFAEVALAISLRNEFVHFAPAWQTHNVAASSGMTEFPYTLQGRFAENLLATPNNPFYPDRVLGYGCASWALTSVLAFADVFWGRVGVEAKYAAYRDRLSVR